MRPGGIRILAVLLLLSAHAALADPTLAQLERALTLLRSKEYQAAIEKVSPLFEGLKLQTVEQIILGHKILGVSYCELGDQVKAEEHFKALLTFSPTESVRTLVVTKPCARIYASLQSAELGPTKAPPPPVPKAEPAALPSPAVAAPSPAPAPLPAKKETGAWKRYVPFGVGQFANDQPSKGMAFLATETLMTVTAGVMYGLYQAEKKADGTFDYPDRANAYRAVFWSSVGIGSAALVWGILDAVWVYKLRMRVAPTAAFVTYDF